MEPTSPARGVGVGFHCLLSADDAGQQGQWERHRKWDEGGGGDSATKVGAVHGSRACVVSSDLLNDSNSSVYSFIPTYPAQPDPLPPIHEPQTPWQTSRTRREHRDTLPHRVRQTYSLTPSRKTFKLNTGDSIPAIGLGTWQSQPGEVGKAVEAALRAGYRHIDTAFGYGNEKEVGEGIRASGVPREQIWLTTKLDNPWHKRVAEGIEQSLKNLGTSYVDLYLMHWPASIDPENPDKVLLAARL